jgi:Haem-binding domain
MSWTLSPFVKRVLKRAGLVLIALLVAAQFVPLARTNPPVTREVRWDSPATRALVQRACFDCHSNLTVWPWYSHIAPASFLVVDHVTSGRRHLNFTEWDKPQEETFDDIRSAVTAGDMPIWNYVLAHPRARLSPAEKTQLLAGLEATFRQDPPIERQR